MIVYSRVGWGGMCKEDNVEVGGIFRFIPAVSVLYLPLVLGHFNLFGCVEVL